MARNPTLIRHPDELSGLSTLPGFRMPGRGRIHLAEAQSLEPGAREEFERRLNRLYFACGCDKAAFGLALGVVCYVGWVGLDRGFGSWSWADLWVGLAVVVAATAAGKLIGRMIAERAFRDAVDDLQQVWKVPRPREGEADGCG